MFQLDRMWWRGCVRFTMARYSGGKSMMMGSSLCFKMRCGGCGCCTRFVVSMSVINPISGCVHRRMGQSLSGGYGGCSSRLVKILLMMLSWRRPFRHKGAAAAVAPAAWFNVKCRLAVIGQFEHYFLRRGVFTRGAGGLGIAGQYGRYQLCHRRLIIYIQWGCLGLIVEKAAVAVRGVRRARTAQNLSC